MTTENLEGSNCQVIDMIFRILWRRLLQAPCWELNQLQKKKWTEKWRKWAWIYVQTLMSSINVMNLAEAFHTCWDESLQIMECSQTRVCVSVCVDLNWLMFCFKGSRGSPHGPQTEHEGSDNLPLAYATSVVPHKPEARLFWRGKTITKVLMILRDPLSK